MTTDWRRRVGRLGLAASIPFWGQLVLAFGSRSAPFANAAWVPGEILTLGVVAIAAGFTARSEWGLAATFAGLSSAFALEIFVLTARASWVAYADPSAVAAAAGPGWLRDTIVAVIVGFAAVAVGFGFGSIARRLTGRAPSEPTPALPTRSTAQIALAPLAALAACLGLIVLLVIDASSSAYVERPAAAELIVVIRGDTISSLDPVTLRTASIGAPDGGSRIGYVQLRADLTQASSVGVRLTGPLSDADLSLLRDGKVDRAFEGVSLKSPTFDSVFVLEAGSYAVYTSSWLTGELLGSPEPDWSGQRDILDSRTFVVAAEPTAGNRRRGDGGSLQVVGFLVALIVSGLALFASIIPIPRANRDLDAAPGCGARATAITLVAVVALLAIAMFSFATVVIVAALALMPGLSLLIGLLASRLTGRAGTIAATIAAVTTIVFGGILLLAIDITHNPF